MPAKKAKNTKVKIKAKTKKILVKKAPAPIKKLKTKAKPVQKNAKPIKKALAKKTIKIVKKPAPKKPIKKILVKKPSPKKIVAKKAPIKKPLKIKAKAQKELKKPLVTKKEIKSTIINKVEKKEIAPKELAKKAAETPSGKNNFKIGEYAIYPSHGVGQITGIEDTKIMGQNFSFYLMNFEKEKLIVKIPVASAKKVGLRQLASKSQLEEVFSILRSGIKKVKGMWSRRAQEYETKINSGDIILLAEVLRDLTRDIEDGERSYSERIIYETAIHRLASEYSAVYSVNFEEAKDKVIITAKDKLMSESKPAPKDDFDAFDIEGEEAEDAEEEEIDEDEDEDEDYDDEDDDKPKKKRK